MTQIYGGSAWAALATQNIDPMRRLSAPRPSDESVAASVKTLVSACHGDAVRAGSPHR